MKFLCVTVLIFELVAGQLGEPCLQSLGVKCADQSEQSRAFELSFDSLVTKTIESPWKPVCGKFRGNKNEGVALNIRAKYGEEFYMCEICVTLANVKKVNVTYHRESGDDTITKVVSPKDKVICLRESSTDLVTSVHVNFENRRYRILLTDFKIVACGNFKGVSCICSCSDVVTDEDKANASDMPRNSCPNQIAIEALLQAMDAKLAGLSSPMIPFTSDLLDSVTSSIADLNVKLEELKDTVDDLKESLPQRVNEQFNISWTILPGESNNKTSFPGDIVWEGAHVSHPRDCQEILDAGDSHGDGIYRIYSSGKNEFINVKCDMTCDGGGWLVLMQHSNNSLNFNRTWDDYVSGFGKLQGDFWMGLEFIHQITSQYKSVDLRMNFVSFENQHHFIAYKDFFVDNELQKFKLRITGYAGSMGNYMYSFNNGRMFSTYDKDNDGYSTYNCAHRHGGGWWYNGNSACGYVWPTGVIDKALNAKKLGGISYYNKLYQEVTMKIRPAFDAP